MTAERVMACFSAFLVIVFGAIALWLAIDGQSLERSVVWYWVICGVCWLLGVVFIRAAIIGKLPKWFETFLDAQ